MLDQMNELKVWTPSGYLFLTQFFLQCIKACNFQSSDFLKKQKQKVFEPIMHNWHLYIHDFRFIHFLTFHLSIHIIYTYNQG